MSGSVVSVAPRLEVRVVVTNRGDRPAAPLEVAGELLGERREARLADGVAPGRRGRRAPRLRSRERAPGHSTRSTLLLEHPVEGPPDGAGNPPVASQRAWLLLALGASPGARRAPRRGRRSRLDVRGDLARAARERRRRAPTACACARSPRAACGRRATAREVAVPRAGAAPAALPLVRAGAPRGSRHAVLLVAEALDGPLARTAVLAAPVEVAPDPSLLPRLRARSCSSLGLAARWLSRSGFEGSRVRASAT